MNQKGYFSLQSLSHPNSASLSLLCKTVTTGLHPLSVCMAVVICWPPARNLANQQCQTEGWRGMWWWMLCWDSSQSKAEGKLVAGQGKKAITFLAFIASVCKCDISGFPESWLKCLTQCQLTSCLQRLIWVGTHLMNQEARTVHSLNYIPFLRLFTETPSYSTVYSYSVLNKLILTFNTAC